jgi:hypothetical protein
MFIQDESIQCGDNTQKSFRYIYNLSDEDMNSFGFECVTPILSIHGKVTHDKVCEQLMPLLDFFGLYKPECYIQNFSMGYHVNISLYNKEINSTIPIADSPILNRLLPHYINKERELYSQVRTFKPTRKAANGTLKKPENYESEFAKRWYKLFNKKHNMSRSRENTIKNIMDSIDIKRMSLFRKNDDLLEFRLFESRNDPNKLCEFATTAIQIVHDVIV